MDSILFLEQQLEEILKLGVLENRKIFLIANLKFLNQSKDEELRIAHNIFAVYISIIYIKLLIILVMRSLS